MTTPVAPPARPDTTPPSAPGTLSASRDQRHPVDLSWGAATDNVAVSGYHIERCQGAGCTTFAEIGTATTTNYSDTTTAAGTSYSYRVRANDAAPNLGPYTNTTTPTPPPDPTTTHGAGHADRKRDQRPPRRSQLGRRHRQRRGDRLPDRALPGHWLQQLRPGRADGTGTTYQDTGLTACTSYSYEVRAVDAAGNTGPSPRLHGDDAGTDTQPPSAPGR